MKTLFQFITVLFLPALLCPVYLFSQNEEKNENERRGPNGRFTFDIISQIEADHDFTEYKLLSVSNTIFQDDNPKSGFFYYYPAEYSLNWVEARKTDRYDFNINYGTNGQVTLTAVLKPKLSTKDLQLAKKLLRQSMYGIVEDDVRLKELAPMPLAQTPEIDFSNLSQFGVEEANISIRAPSDLTEPILVSFTTNRIDDLMNMFFNDIGLYGDVIIYPNGVDMPQSIRIPFNLKIDDPKTYGRFELSPHHWRKEQWQNQTDFPVVLSYLHLLREEAGGRFRTYTWELGDTEVPEQAGIKFTNMATVPDWLDQDTRVHRMWLDYTIKPCRSCNRRVRNEIDEGSENKTIETIEVTILYPLEYTRAEMIKLKLRSFQADPNTKTKANLETITIRQDGADFQRGPLYIAAGERPEFEYQLQVIMPDGKIHSSRQWTKVQGLDVAIGERQVREQVKGFR